MGTANELSGEKVRNEGHGTDREPAKDAASISVCRRHVYD